MSSRPASTAQASSASRRDLKTTSSHLSSPMEKSPQHAGPAASQMGCTMNFGAADIRPGYGGLTIAAIPERGVLPAGR